MGVAGHVLNDSRGVVVEVEAPSETVERFLARLPAEAPPLATVERVTAEELEEVGELGFSIRESPAGGEPRAAVTPDSATCADCLAELFDPADRRFRYPFTNCTNCGPRFTIVRDVPYDRPNTTMAGFAMCAACRAEYEDPADRRFHAQPNACPGCGPRVRLAYAGGGAVEDARAPPTRSRRPPVRSGTARSSRSRGSAASTSPAWPETRTRWRSSERESTARTSRSR
jgi:hydrogenase maturation protein HypF